MNNQNQKPISEEIIAKIKTKGVKMHPRIYFIVKTIFLALTVAGFSLMVLYFASFTVFSMRASGTWFMPKFGFPGIKIFLSSLPLLPISMVIILIIVLEIISKRFNFIYRRPIIYSLLVISIFAIAGGFLLEKMPFHSSIFLKAQRENMPGIGNFYRNSGAHPRKETGFGVVILVTDNGFLIQSPDSQTTTIITTKETRLPPDESITEGDIIVILGKPENGTIKAFEIHEIKENFNFFPPPPPPL
jgi:hypothetical protein